MGLAASCTASFARVRDVPLSQNEGIRYPPSLFQSFHFINKLSNFIYSVTKHSLAHIVPVCFSDGDTRTGRQQ